LAPLAIRYQKDFARTPSWRSYVGVAPSATSVIATKDPANAGTPLAINMTFDPVHVAKARGIVWRLATAKCTPMGR